MSGPKLSIIPAVAIEDLRLTGLDLRVLPPPRHVGSRVPPLLLHYYGYDFDLEIIIDAPSKVPGVDASHCYGYHQANNEDPEVTS